MKKVVKMVGEVALCALLGVSMGLLLAGGVRLLTDGKGTERFVTSQVVKLTPPSRNNTGGTGFSMMAPSGKVYIMTNAHICEGAENGKLRAHLANNRGSVLVNVIEQSNEDDLCIVEGVPSNVGLNVATLEPTSEEDIYAFGHPILQGLTITKGRLLELTTVTLIDETKDEKTCTGVNRRFEEVMSFFGPMRICIVEYTARASSVVIYPGNSGSPVVNEDGEVVGVAFASYRGVPYGRIVPLHRLKAFIKGY